MIKGVIEDSDILCYTKTDMKPDPNSSVTRIAMVSRKGLIKWRLELSPSEVFQLHLNNGFIFMAKSDNSILKTTGSITKYDMEGHIISHIVTEHCDDNLEFIDEHLYQIGTRYSEYVINKVLYKFDMDIQTISKLELPKGISTAGRPLKDTQRKLMYFETLEDSILSVELDTMDYRITKKPFDFWLYAVDQNGLLYGVSGNSTVCIFDSELKMVSRHPLKGEVRSICETNTGMHVVTTTIARRFKETPSTVQVYRIDPV